MNKMMTITNKFVSNKQLNAIKNGMVAYSPFTIVASIALLISNFPSQTYIDFMTKLFNVKEASIWQSQVNSFMNGTMNLAAIICVLFISYFLTKEYNDDEVQGIYAAVLSLCVYFLMTPVVEIDGTNVVEFSKLGATSLVVAIIIGLIVPELYRFFLQKRLTIKLPNSVPPTVSKSFSALIPIGLTLSIFFVIKLLLELTIYGNIHDIINQVIGTPMSALSGSLFGYIIALLLTEILWVLGIHGSSIIMGGALAPFLLMLSDQNRIAYENSEVLPNILTNEFLTFATSHGLYICIAALIVSRSSQMKEVSKLGFVPAVFGIHEPLVFGYPIMYNFYLGILYIFLPILGTILTYFVTKMGWVAQLTGTGVPWTTPPGLYGFIATGGHISGAIWQIILGILYVLLSIPLVKLYDRNLVKKEQEFQMSENNKSEEIN